MNNNLLTIHWQENLRSALWIDLLILIIIRLYFWLYYVYLVIDLFIDWYFIRGCDLITPLRAFWMTIFFLIMMLLKDRLNQIYGEIIYRKKQKIRKILIILLFPHGFDWKLCQSLNINPLQLGVAFLQPLKTFSDEWKKRHKCLILMLNLKLSK